METEFWKLNDGLRTYSCCHLQLRFTFLGHNPSMLLRWPGHSISRLVNPQKGKGRSGSKLIEKGVVVDTCDPSPSETKAREWRDTNIQWRSYFYEAIHQSPEWWYIEVKVTGSWEWHPINGMSSLIGSETTEQGPWRSSWETCYSYRGLKCSAPTQGGLHLHVTPTPGI